MQPRSRWVLAGDRLPEAAWRSRHRAIIVIALLHAVVLPLIGARADRSNRQIAVEVAPVAALAMAAAAPWLSRRMRSAAAALSLAGASAVLVHLVRDAPEAQLHVFVIIPILALYQDWLPLGLAAAFVLLHHGLVATVAPQLVFDSVPAPDQPWRWAGAHAAFVGAESIVCLLWWRIHEGVLTRQRQAERELLEEKQIVETLHDVGTGVVAELNVERVAELVTDAAVKATGAAYGAFFYNVFDGAGERHMLYTLSGAPRSAFETFPIPRNTKIFEPTFSGSGILRIDNVLIDERYGKNAPYLGMPPGHPPVRSYLAVPVRSRGSSEVLGGLFFGHPDAGVFTEAHERIAVGIATQAAIAFDNARLYEAERSAYESAESARGRLALLDEVGRLIATSLDQDVTLHHLARLAVPALADGCLIDVLTDDERLVRIAAGAPGLESFADTLRKFPPDPTDDEHPIVRVMRGDGPILVEDVTTDFLELVTRDARRAALQAAVRSAIIVPLVARGRTYGALSLITTDISRRRLTTDDLTLAEEIGRRTGIAVENARLYTQQRTVAESLQHALLPQQLPTIPGFETTARYLPGSPGERVGGDWYDLFETSTGEIAIAIGDVVGHGIPAASLMAQLRNALRAYVWDGRDPADVLSRLNQLLYGLEKEGMATACLGLLNPVTSELRLASAGHPPVLHVRAGETSFVGEGLGPPLGAIQYARYRSEVVELRPEDTAVFYTDGLVEERSLSLDEGLERMRTAIVEGADTIEELSDNVVARCLGERSVDDDVAMLILRSIPLTGRLALHLPAEPRILASLRQTLRRWLHEHGVSDVDAQDVLIACGEAFNNAIEHSSATMRPWFDIEADIDDDLRVVVRNTGPWRNPRDDGGGRGLPVMRALMDDVEIDEGPESIEVRLRRKLNGVKST